ncbi:cell division protein DamX [Cedecea colo]|uniref:Cell division protein DamX n=1 Tax=Cedecea colo TaxID=2552946 RepID=A0ABX0VQT3_9ENTR|nr:cell division protein DamX [Cedecea colo]NIY49430.1 cell division protein DamX [Cedecea colo]
MDEFKPEDELKPDPSDRRRDRSRNSDEFDNEPQINVDDIDIDADEPRSSRSRRPRDEEEEYEGDDGLKVEAVERRPARGRKKAPQQKAPVSRQHLMMGIGILVLLLLIIGIGSALKSPSTDTETANKNPNAEKSIDLSGSNDSVANQANGSQPQPGDATVADQTANKDQQPQEVNLPPISSTPTEAQTQPIPEGQQRVEVPGDLNNALTAQQGQIDNAASGSTLPTQPATVARVAGGNTASVPTQASNNEPVRQPATRPERKKVVIEPHKTQPAQAKPQATAKTTVAEPKPVVTAKRSEPVVTAPVKEPVKAPAATAAPKATASAPAASGATVSGDASAIKGAPGSHYTLQLSSSSNSTNLNAWAKKEKLQHYMVYQTVRNGQPWYVLVSGVYASKDEAKRAVATLPADVQAKNPWAKPIHQVQSDLK